MGFSNPEALSKVLDALRLPQFPHQNEDNAERCIPLSRSPDINIIICGTVAEPVLAWGGHVLEANRNPCRRLRRKRETKALEADIILYVKEYMARQTRCLHALSCTPLSSPEAGSEQKDGYHHVYGCSSVWMTKSCF